MTVWKPWAAAAWVAVVVVWFFAGDLAGGVSRAGLLLNLDGALLGEADPTVRTGLRFLDERIRPLAHAAGFWLVSGCWGVLLLWLLGGRRDSLRLTAAERLTFSLGVGAAAVSIVLGVAAICGSVGIGYGLALFGWMILTWPALFGFRRDSPLGRLPLWRSLRQPHGRGRPLPLLAAAPFLAAFALASTLPATEFDAKEYHLQAAKESWYAGRVERLPHNVYTQFPLGAEMHLLLAMESLRGWRTGALAGQAFLAGFVPLTGLACYCVARRLVSPAAGVWAAVVFLTSPWAVRFAAHPLAEGGLTAYLALTLLAVTVAVRRRRQAARSPAVLAGLCAGAAFACKYPAAVQAVIPGAVALAATGWFGGKRAWRKVGWFLLATLPFAGPWLVRNVLDAGNPVFPLLWGVLGGGEAFGWDAATNARWTANHSPPDWSPAKLPRWFAGPLGADPFHSVLVLAFLPLCFLRTRNRERVLWLAAATGGLLLAWYGLTHRLDRFWAPLLPGLCVLAGAGATAVRAGWWRWMRGGLLTVAACFNLAVANVLAVPLPMTANLNDAVAAAERTAPFVAALNERFGPGDAVVLVGEAQVFDARFTGVYATAWNLAPLAEPDEPLPPGAVAVAVNWLEIARYRDTYGFDPRVRPGFLDARVRRGELEPAEPVTVEGNVIGEIYRVR